MNISVSINTQPHETMVKTAQQVADEIMTAVGGDPELDTISVNVSAVAGVGGGPLGAPMLAGAPEPPAPRTIG